MLFQIVFILLSFFSELSVSESSFLFGQKISQQNSFVSRLNKKSEMDLKLKNERHHYKSLEFYNCLVNSGDNYINKQIRKALDSLSDALRLYGPEQVLSSYNGGKDADVTMHLLRAAVAKYSQDKGVIHSPKLVYFEVEDDFDEVLEHIKHTECIFDLEVQRYQCGIVEGIKQHMATSAVGVSPAFVLGTRKGDPNCGCQETFSPSSDWMPVPFMRVNPILHWEYGHVWHFLRTFSLPYCTLYDHGYTSLGKRALTQPNPALKKRRSALLVDNIKDDKQSEDAYWPAHLLEDWSLERAGRISPPLKHVPTSVDTECTSCDSGSSPVSSSPSSLMTAGVIVVNNAVMNGVESDWAAPTVVSALRAIGMSTERVAIVRHSEQDIVEEVRRMALRHEVVLVASSSCSSESGLSPTVMPAVGRALHKKLVESIELRKYLGLPQLSGHDRTSSEAELSVSLLLPESTELLFTDSAALSTVDRKVWPVLKCENVFVLSGSTLEGLTEQIKALTTTHFVKQ